MRLIVDTHAAIWALTLDPRLSAHASAALRDPANQTLLSAVVPWEIAIKRAIGKLRAPDQLVERFLADGALPLPVSLEHAAAVEFLPLVHGDPFDRLLLAQATVEGASIVSADPAFRPYDVPIVW